MIGCISSASSIGRASRSSRENQEFAWQRLAMQPMAEPMLPANAPVLASLALPLRIRDYRCCRPWVSNQQLARVEAQHWKDGLKPGAGARQGASLGALADHRRQWLPEIGHCQYGAKVLVNGGPIPGGRWHPFQRCGS